MQAYHYDEETGFLVGVSLADEDPMTPGEYLLPAHATFVTPPNEVAGILRKFEDGQWVEVELPPVEPEEPEEEEPEPENTAPTEADVIEERELRLSRGFFYDFGDERGEHQFATTAEDMKNWDEVTKASTAAIITGSPDAQLAIRTNTGPVIVSAMDWQNILIHAANVRQPIFQSSFALQAMDPIPEDFKDQKYWEA